MRTNIFSKALKSLAILFLFVGFSSPFAQAQAPAAGWTQMPGAAVDIGAAGAGQVWVTNKGQNIYRWVNNNWTQMPGAAVRVAVDPSGNAWVVNAGGGI